MSRQSNVHRRKSEFCMQLRRGAHKASIASHTRHRIPFPSSTMDPHSTLVTPPAQFSAAHQPSRSVLSSLTPLPSIAHIHHRRALSPSIIVINHASSFDRIRLTWRSNWKA
eukprot:1309983-Rhodomonas_salina.1